jgi:hypothetical protein
MPSGADGKHYRSYGQAERFGKKSEDKTDNAEGGNEVEGKDKMMGSGVTAIKHTNGGPPYKIKHEDGQVTSHDSHDEAMQEMHKSVPGGEEKMADDSQMDADYGSEGSKQALDSLLG